MPAACTTPRSLLRDRDNYTGGTPNPMTSASDGTLEERRYFCQNWRADVVAVTKSDGTPLEYVRYSAYGEPTVYPVADLNMDGVVNSTDSSLWSDLLYDTANASVYAGTDLDWDGADDWNSGGADGDLFYESYNENLGLSGVGRVSSPGVDSRTGYAGYQWDQTLSAYHVRYRVYLPDIGRWTRRDPLGYVDGMGLYQYVLSCVLRYVDPMGLGKICYRPMPTPPVVIPQIRIPVPWYQFPGDELEPPEWWPEYIRTPGLIPSITIPSWLMQWWLRSLYPYLSPIQWWPEHQHIYYEDGLSPPNEGFFPDGVRPEKPNAPGPGRCTRTGLDDGRLRAAARYCRNFVGTFCVPGSYSLLTNNCQDFAQCVSDQYDRLTAQTRPGWGVPFLLKPFCY